MEGDFVALDMIRRDLLFSLYFEREERDLGRKNLDVVRLQTRQGRCDAGAEEGAGGEGPSFLFLFQSRDEVKQTHSHGIR